jgi:hypothetical protein
VSYPRYACVRYVRELLSLLVFISGGYFAVSLLTQNNVLRKQNDCGNFDFRFLNKLVSKQVV